MAGHYTTDVQGKLDVTGDWVAPNVRVVYAGAKDAGDGQDNGDTLEWNGIISI